MDLIQIDIVMNTRQRIKGHWIKKSILATLLMGLCCLFATIDIDQVGQGIERWGENLGRSAEEAGESIGNAARAAADSDVAHAAARQAKGISEWAKNANTQAPPPRPANQLARRPVTNTLPPSPGLAPAAARAGASPTGNLDDLSIKLQGTANDALDMQAKQASPVSVPQPGASPKRTAMDDDFDKSMAQARQQYGNRLYQQYMGGATTAKERAIGALRMENAIAEAEGKGDSTQANYLRQQLAMAQRTNEWYNGELQQKANAGDTRAQRELDEYYAFMKTVEGSSPAGSFPFLISIISGLLLYGYIVLFSPKDATINRKTLIPWCVGLAVFDMLGNWVNQSWLFLFVEILVILVVTRNFQCSWKRSFAILGLMLVSILILGGLLPLFL